MRTVLAGGLALVMLATIGCVIRTQHTIDAHIRVDIRHIQEQADAVLDFIEGRRDTIPLENDGNPGPSSWLHRFMDTVSPVQVAHARDLEETSPEARRIAESLRDRHSAIESLKNDGCLGEDNRGYVQLRDCDALDTPEKRAEAEELLGEENADREALYEEIARLNADRNVSKSQIERIFAQRRLERAPSGHVVQLPPQGDAFDKFKNTATGRRLGDEARPGNWVTLP